MKICKLPWLGALLAVIGLSFSISNAAFADEGQEKAVELSCAGNSCIQIGIRQGSWTLFFYTSSPTDITVERAMQQALTPSGTPLSYTATYFQKPAGYAAMIINGTPSTTNGKFGTTYWALCVNGKAANLGMSAQPVKNGDKVLWTYTTYPPAC